MHQGPYKLPIISEISLSFPCLKSIEFLFKIYSIFLNSEIVKYIGNTLNISNKHTQKITNQTCMNR